MRAELYNHLGYIAAFDMPPFKMAPIAVNWDGHCYSRVGEAVHSTQCVHINRNKKPESAACSCDGGVWAYRESGEARNDAFRLDEMFLIEKGRDKPMTKL